MRISDLSSDVCSSDLLDMADHVVKAPYAQLSHDFAHLFGNEEEVIHHIFRLALKLLAQNRVLRCNANGAGVQVAFAHHDAAFHHQRRGCKRSEEHTSELQSLMRISYAVFCLKK